MKVGDIFNTFNEFEAALERFKSTKFEVYHHFSGL